MQPWLARVHGLQQSQATSHGAACVLHSICVWTCLSTSVRQNRARASVHACINNQGLHNHGLYMYDCAFVSMPGNDEEKSKVQLLAYIGLCRYGISVMAYIVMAYILPDNDEEESKVEFLLPTKGLPQPVRGGQRSKGPCHNYVDHNYPGHNYGDQRLCRPRLYRTYLFGP